MHQDQSTALDPVGISRAADLYFSGRYAEALLISESLLSAQPSSVELLNLAAFCSLMLSREDDAENYWLGAIKINPGYAACHQNLGCLFERRQRLPEAEEFFRRAIVLRHDYRDAYHSLVALLHKQQRLVEAEVLLQRWIEQSPNDAQANYNLGVVLHGQNRLSEAESSYRRAINLCANHSDAYGNLGNILMAKNCLQDAEDAYKKAILLNRDNVVAHYNLGLLFQEAQRLKEAEDAYLCAIHLCPEYAKAYNNLGSLYGQQKRMHDAEMALQRAISLSPGYVEPIWNLGLLYLSLGRYSDAWPLYESRKDPNRVDRTIVVPDFAWPEWCGESLNGRSILVVGEQGFGDEIQFARYLPLLKARGVRHITLACRPELHGLLRDVQGVDIVLRRDEVLSATPHDYWVFLLSLPGRFETTLTSIPAHLPYLMADAGCVQRWQKRMPTAGIRVGLLWKGSAIHKNDANRSLPNLGALAPLWQVPGVQFISLQKGQAEDEAKNAPLHQPITHLGSDIDDFSDSAAIVAQLDLIICVDTSAAHLAGALNKICWVLLPNRNTDWRWLQERSDSPWYPNVVRLFRQKEGEGWAPVIEDVVTALAEFVASPRLKSSAPF